MRAAGCVLARRFIADFAGAVYLIRARPESAYTAVSILDAGRNRVTYYVAHAPCRPRERIGFWDGAAARMISAYSLRAKAVHYVSPADGATSLWRRWGWVVRSRFFHRSRVSLRDGEPSEKPCPSYAAFFCCGVAGAAVSGMRRVSQENTNNIMGLRN